MTAHSPLTRDLIAAGLRRSTSADPLADAMAAIMAARQAVLTAAMFEPGPQRDARIDDAALHLGTAQHHLASERVRRERAA